MSNQVPTLYLDIAQRVAQESTCPRASVGAVISKDGRVIATGYNGAPRGMKHCTEVGCLMYHRDQKESCLRAVHAEVNAVLNAAYHGVGTQGGTMWCTHRPCVDCYKFMINAGIVAIKYTLRYDDGLLDKMYDNILLPIGQLI